MAKIEQYRQMVQDILITHSKIDFGNPEIVSELILDTERASLSTHAYWLAGLAENLWLQYTP